MKFLPLVGQPLGQLADGQGRKVDQQLREIELRIHVMSAACAGQAGQDGRGSSTTRIAHEERVLAVEHDALHLSLTHIVIDGHRAIGREDVQLLPLAQGIVDRLGHGMLGQQLLLPLKKPIMQLRQ